MHVLEVSYSTLTPVAAYLTEANLTALLGIRRVALLDGLLNLAAVGPNISNAEPVFGPRSCRPQVVITASPSSIWHATLLEGSAAAMRQQPYSVTKIHPEETLPKPPLGNRFQNKSSTPPVELLVEFYDLPLAV